MIDIQKTKKRDNGILMHITSLPSKYCIGDFGKEAYDFVDFLKTSNVGIWQLLPIGPTGYGNSPYASRSTFAGNELLISLDKLIDNGLLNKKDIVFPDYDGKKVNYYLADSWKKPLLFKAADNFINQNKQSDKDYLDFVEKSKFFLDDYCLFMALCDHYYDARWYSVWDEKLGKRDEKALEEAREKFSKQINQYKVLQFFFFKQWKDLKSYANENDILIIGDLPIFVAGDSVDAWTETKLLKTDENGQFSYISGCPPDGFTADGQLWGNPVYDWETNKNTNYKWWIKRIEAQLDLFDIIRIDHFRGFDSYWQVPAGEKTARNGVWTPGPKQDLFDAIKKELGVLPIIAEDLGYLTKSVEKLRDDNNFPGMKIGIFGFSWDENKNLDLNNMDLPDNYIENCIAYPGTHDNQTINGWYQILEDYQKESVKEYLKCNDKNVAWALIEKIYESKAKFAIIQLQDLLEMNDEQGRMNIPSTCGDFNWSWKLYQNTDLSELKTKLVDCSKKYKR